MAMMVYVFFSAVGWGPRFIFLGARGEVVFLFITVGREPRFVFLGAGGEVLSCSLS